MFILIALVGTTLAAAPAAPILPSTCGADGATLCVNLDGDKFYANAKLAEQQDCVDDPATNWLAARIFPGAPVIIGDGAAVDSNCDATVGGRNEGEERAAVEAAAKGGWSALEKSLDLCVESDREIADGDFVWAYKRGVGYTCVFKPESGYDGWSYDRESGVKDRSVVVEARRRIAGDRASVASARESLGHPSAPAVFEADGVTVRFAAIPAPEGSLWAELEATRAAAAKATGDARVSLEARIEGLEAVVTVGVLTDTRQDRELRVLQKDVGDLKTSRPIIRIGGAGFVWGGAPLDEYEDGPRVRSGTIAGLAATLTLGVNVGQYGAGFVGVDILGGAGGTESYGEIVGGGLASAGIFYQRWMGDIGIGPVVLVGVNATSNVLDPMGSGGGGGFGVKGSFAMSSANAATCATVDTTLAVVAENYGTNDEWFTRPAVVFSIGVSGGTCPR